MARYRKIDPRIWNDEKFRALSDSGKLAFFFLLTHPHMTALGAMRATLPGLAAEIGWKSEAFREAFGEASSKGMAEHDENACLIALPQFLKYNVPESPNVVKAWASAIDLLPECGLKTLVLQRAKAFAEALQEGFAKAFREAFPKGIAIQEQEQEQQPEQEKEKPSASSQSADRDLLGGKPVDLQSTRAARIAQVTDDAISAFNASKLVKPNGGLLATVNPKVGKERRQKQVQRCVRTARDICQSDYSADRIVPEFWPDYWAAVEKDDFLAGRRAGGQGHENWKPDFDYLTREATMLKVYDRASAEDAA